MSRLRKVYNEEVKPELIKKFNYKNVLMVPKIKKIVVNSCSKEAVVNGKVIDSIVSDLQAVTGQKPIVTKAKKSIAAFKLRQGQAIGASVTLRGDSMYNFLDRLISLALPRVRDFRGVPRNAFDGRGNYTLGLKEQIIFPEIEYDNLDKIRGMGVTIVTSAKSNDEGRELLEMLGIPFNK